MLAGNVVALLSPLIFIPVLTLAFGRQNYDWESMKQIRRGDDSDITGAADVDPELASGATSQTQEMEAAEQAKLKKAAIIARSLTVFMTLALLVIWPMPMYGSGYIFSKSFFTGKETLPYSSDHTDLCLRLGDRGHHVALFQYSLCRHFPAMAGPEDDGAYAQVHVPRHRGQKTAHYTGSSATG